MPPVSDQSQSPIQPMGPLVNPYFGLLPMAYVGLAKDPFQYTIQLTVTTGSTGVGSTNVQNDSDFVWTQATMTVTTTNGQTFTAADSVPGFVLITDTASGRQLQNAQVPLSSIFGTAQRPFQLVPPKIFRAGSQITAQILNQAAGTLVFNLVFAGFKVFAIAAQ